MEIENVRPQYRRGLRPPYGALHELFLARGIRRLERWQQTLAASAVSDPIMVCDRQILSDGFPGEERAALIFDDLNRQMNRSGYTGWISPERPFVYHHLKAISKWGSGEGAPAPFRLWFFSIVNRAVQLLEEVAEPKITTVDAMRFLPIRVVMTPEAEFGCTEIEREFFSKADAEVIRGFEGLLSMRVGNRFSF